MSVLEAGNVTLTLAAASIGQIIDVSAPDKTLNVLTDHFIGSDEPTKTPTNFDYGQATFTVAFDPDDTGHTALATAQDAKTLGSWEIVDSGATLGTFAFTGYVTNVGGVQTSGGDKLTMSFTVDVVSTTDWAI